MDNFERSGLWWLPSKDAHAIGGTLSFSHKDGIKLHLLGSLTDQIQAQKISEHALILGITDNNELVTLQNCIQSHFRVFSNGFDSQDFKIQFAYFGVHVVSKDDLHFKRVRVQYSYLFDWVNRSSFDLADTTDPQKYILTYTNPEVVTAYVPDGILSITSSFYFTPHQANPSMSQILSIQFEIDRSLSLPEWLNQYISPFQDFLSLATAQPNAVTKIVFSIPQEDVEPVEEQLKQPKFVNVQAFLEVVYHSEQVNAKLEVQRMLFTFKEVDDFNQTISNWMQVNNALKTVCNLFFGMQYAPAAYLDSRFLVSAQAAEMYHRLRYTNKILPLNEHKQQMRTILKRIPKKHSRWVKEQLAFSNEPRLLQRILDLLTLAEDIMLPIIKDKNKFAKKVKDTRNYYTHYNATIKDKSAVADELFWINEALILLLQRCFLHELGFSSEQCVSLFERNRRYSFALSNAKFSWD